MPVYKSGEKWKIGKHGKSRFKSKAAAERAFKHWIDTKESEEMTKKVDEKFEFSKEKEKGDEGSDVRTLMKMAGIDKKMEDNKEGDIDFDGMFTGVADGEIKVKENEDINMLQRLAGLTEKKLKRSIFSRDQEHDRFSLFKEFDSRHMNEDDDYEKEVRGRIVNQWQGVAPDATAEGPMDLYDASDLIYGQIGQEIDWSRIGQDPEQFIANALKGWEGIEEADDDEDLGPNVVKGPWGQGGWKDPMVRNPENAGREPDSAEVLDKFYELVDPNGDGSTAAMEVINWVRDEFGIPEDAATGMVHQAFEDGGMDLAHILSGDQMVAQEAVIPTVQGQSFSKEQIINMYKKAMAGGETEKANMLKTAYEQRFGNALQEFDDEDDEEESVTYLHADPQKYSPRDLIELANSRFGGMVAEQLASIMGYDYKWSQWGGQSNPEPMEEQNSNALRYFVEFLHEKGEDEMADEIAAFLADHGAPAESVEESPGTARPDLVARAKKRGLDVSDDISAEELNTVVLDTLKRKYEEVSGNRIPPGASTEEIHDLIREFFASKGIDVDAYLRENAPEGWEGTVKAMKKHKEIDNPYALANWMKKKGRHSHHKEGIDEMMWEEFEKKNKKSKMFAEGSYDRMIIELIVEEMKKGKDVDGISETLGFDSDEVFYVVEFFKNKKLKEEAVEEKETVTESKEEDAVLKRIRFLTEYKN